ncbi:MAG: S9 family peptidase [Rhodospirillales bacterium]|jgi:oligopeptidase B|nr:S9 family peptidase [Rhodospirillales bacterium]
MPPKAPTRITRFVRHGHTREDPYAWLKDPDWQQVMRRPEILNPEIRSYLEAENAYTDATLAPLAALRNILFEELKGRIEEEDETVPAPDGEWAYFRRFVAGGQHPHFCRRRTARPTAEEVILDGDTEASDDAFFRIRQCRHGPDHRFLAYAVDRRGSERHVIQFRDLDSGATLDDRLDDAHGDMAWANDGPTLYYTVLDENHRPARIRRHRLGDDPASDAVVYEEPDASFYLSLEKTASGRFIIITGNDHATSEVRVLDADDATQPPRLMAARDDGVKYSIAHHEDRFLILTNADGAEDFKIVEAPVTTPGRDDWRDLVAHRGDILIRRILVFRQYLVRLERADGLPRIVVRHIADGAEHDITFEEEAFELGLVSGFEFDTPKLRFTYSSPTTPERVFDYDMARRTRELLKEQQIPSGHDPKDYTVRRLFAAGHEGEPIPVTLVQRRDHAAGPSSPVLLYGYGAYGFSTPAGFAANRFSLIDRGFTYAIAHVRGGTEMGYRWYRTGKLMDKPNTFRDFISVAEHLIDQGLTSAGAIVAHGGSAGGLLMGAVANMRPELFGAVIAEVPFVDVLTTMSDTSLPLTPPEWTEWGNPIEDEEAYRTILSYSPYDNVVRQAYPPILAVAGLTDPRVTYWEPAKWVAKLRALKTDDHTLLLKTHMKAGHAGAAGRFDKLNEVALAQAFALMAMGRAER